MLSSLWQHIRYGNSFSAIEHTTVDNNIQINGIELIKKKDDFTLNKSFEIKDQKELTQFLDTNKHLFLIVNSNKVLFKELATTYDEHEALTIAFQNLKIDDFYYEIYQANDKTFVAICRKEEVDLILANYKELGYTIVGFSLGNLIISQLTGFIDTNEIFTSNDKVHLKNNDLLNINSGVSENASYNINGLEVNNKSVLPLAGILAYYTGTTKTVSNFSSTLGKKLAESYFQKRFFNVGFKFALGFIFSTLLISFLFLSNYASKINTINTALSVNESQKKLLINLSDQVKEKEKLINDFSITSSKASWYLDEIAKVVPSSVLLSSINWQPLVKNIKNDAAVEINNRIIKIEGVSNSPSDFTDFTDTLEQLNWVDKLVINEYGSGKKTATSFELEISF